MTDDRIPTDIWVGAQMRACMARGVPAYVLHKGALASGTVMVKIVMRSGGQMLCKLLNQSRDLDGTLAWMDVFDEETIDEKRADDYIRRNITRDPDVWVVEVEDNTGANPFEGKKLETSG